MRAMADNESRDWCAQIGVDMDDGSILHYKRPGETRLFITVPEEHRRIVALVHKILLFRSQAHFSGGLVWLQRWDIGSPELVRPGWAILESIRRAHGDLRSLEIAPAQLFRSDELVELHAFLVQTIAYGWVADYVPSAGSFFFHSKDNRQICLMADSSETAKELREHFKEWNPTDEDPMVVKLRALEESRKKSS